MIAEKHYIDEVSAHSKGTKRRLSFVLLELLARLTSTDHGGGSQAGDTEGMR